MAWPVGTDAEDKLKTQLKSFLVAGGVATAIDGERITPRIRVVILGAEETRPAIEARCANESNIVRLAEWQAWRVLMDVVADDKSGARRTRNKRPVISSATGALNDLFRQRNFASRNAAGIYNAQLRNERDLRDGVEYKNPFSLECETFTFLKE